MRKLKFIRKDKSSERRNATKMQKIGKQLKWFYNLLKIICGKCSHMFELVQATECGRMEGKWKRPEFIPLAMSFCAQHTTYFVKLRRFQFNFISFSPGLVVNYNLRSNAHFFYSFLCLKFLCIQRHLLYQSSVICDDVFSFC